MSQLSPSEWNGFLSECPDAHLLQTVQWGDLKSNFGWESIRLVSKDVNGSWGAQILFRQLPFGFTFGYLPKGPLFRDQDGGDEHPFPGPSFWQDVDRLCRNKRAVFLKIEPDDWAEKWQEGDLASDFVLSPQAIQPARTIVVDLSGSEEEILARMKQKTRYNIRLAGKKGVQVGPSDDVAAFHQLMETTGQRDQFGIHSLDYYRISFDLFKQADRCALLMAEYEGEAVAGLMVFASGSRSWYLYGASASLHRERMPTYLLQWEAMKWARSKGCLQYDLYGVPDHNAEYLEANFQDHSQGLWGIYRFKRGFGGQVTRAPEPWDRVYNSFLYQLYLRWAARSASSD
jgi:lipid II:glycine glycyltransferase (peptidoglycan interpeptide bridge formation enzyme)